MTFKKIKFVADSVCDIPDDIVKKWDIKISPCYINYGGKSYADDGVDLVRDAYYRELPDMKETPTTAAMPPDVAKEAVMSAYEDADHIFIITTPAKLSGIYNTMRLATADLSPDRVTLIDSGQLSLGIGWQVMVAAEIAAETGDVDEVRNAIERIREQQRVYAGLYTLEFLRRSGRVGWATANVGNLLQIKPVVRVVDGEINVIQRVRTFKRVIDKFVELIEEQAPIDRLALMHINNPEAHQTLLERLKDVVPEDSITGTIGPTLGTHIGPGAIGAAILKQGWR